MIYSAPLEDVRHLVNHYVKLRQEVEAKINRTNLISASVLWLKLRDHIIVMLLISSISYIPRSMVAEEEATESSPKSLPLYLEDAVSHPQEETNSNHRGEIKSIHIEDTECSHQEVTKLNSKNETKSSSPQEEYIFPLNNSKQRKSSIQQSCWCLIKQRSGGWDRLVGRRIQGQSSLHTWRNKGKLLQAK
ncbi:hypothetical protein HID58_066392 [Brassica napus]|uniref:Uncharacterized protein n=1 Tax=Brassica napus TaxID=3708 RepID=A0ABQ7ZFU9_BRANA|nr:hypothetical protein HID58_066392 [Brassica napus]